MNQDERRLYLIEELLKEQPEGQGMKLPTGKEEQKRLLRALFNIRPPRPATQAFLDVQDAYLREETRQKGITDAAALTPVQKGIYLWQGDITTLKCDAIVNAANAQMLGCFAPCHGCIDNAIHTYAGVQLRLACQCLMERQGHEEPVGNAKITPGFNLPCRYVLHTVGPYIAGKPGRGRRTARRLLSVLPGVGKRTRPFQRGLLLHFHGRIPLSQPAGGRNCRADREGLYRKRTIEHRGDFRCLQGRRSRNLPANPRIA